MWCLMAIPSTNTSNCCPFPSTAGDFQKHYLTAGSIMYKEGQRKKIDLMENSLAEQIFTFTVAL